MNTHREFPRHGRNNKPEKGREKLGSVFSGGYVPLDQYKQAVNFTYASRPTDIPITQVVIHRAQGTYQGTLDWFASSSNTGNSAHYTVAYDGRVGQSVQEKDIAWHAGHWTTNQRSIGIELEGYTKDAPSEAMYLHVAKVVAYACKKYGLSVDRSVIIGHSEVPGCSTVGGGGVTCHTDPGATFNWSYFMGLVAQERAALDPPPPPTKPVVVVIRQQDFITAFTALTTTERRYAAYDVVGLKDSPVGKWRGDKWLEAEAAYYKYYNN